MDLSVVDTMPRDSKQPRSRNPQDGDLDWLEATGWAQESLAFLDAAVRGVPVHCPVGTQSRY